jgi:hypothetical protein
MNVVGTLLFILVSMSWYGALLMYRQVPFRLVFGWGRGAQARLNDVKAVGGRNLKDLINHCDRTDG